MLQFSAVIVLPWLLALCVTPLVIRWARAYEFIDYPRERHTHERPTPFVGGVAVFGSATLGLLVAALIYPPVAQGLWGYGSLSVLGVGVVCMLLLGLVDDKIDLSVTFKVVAQLGIAAATWFLGFRVGYVELPMGWVIIDAALPSFLLTVGWIMVVSNAFNLIDGLDGLSSGVGLIVLLTLFVLAADQREAVPVLAALAVGGALAGFLRFNLPPARIFLGDCGALPLGYTAAVVSIGTYQKGSTAMVIALPLLALGLPLLDVLLAIVRRGLAHLRSQGLRGVTPRAVVRAVFRADRGHVHDLLLRSGWSVRRILASLYGVCLLFAFLALAMRRVDPTLRWVVAVGIVLAGLAVLRGLERRVERMEHRDKSAPAHAQRRAAG